MDKTLKLLLQIISATLIISLSIIVLKNIVLINNANLVQAYNVLIEQEKNVSNLIIT